MISLARKKCISQELAGDFTMSNLFLDQAYIKKKKKTIFDICIMVKYVNLYSKKGWLTVFIIKKKKNIGYFKSVFK